MHTHKPGNDAVTGKINTFEIWFVGPARKGTYIGNTPMLYNDGLIWFGFMTCSVDQHYMVKCDGPTFPDVKIDGAIPKYHESMKRQAKLDKKSTGKNCRHHNYC